MALRKKFLNAHLQDILQIFILLFVPYLIVGATYLKPFDISDYLFGLTQVYRNHQSHYAYFMNGRFHVDGFWFYYPYALAVKTPLVSLFTIFAAQWFIRRRHVSLVVLLLLPATCLLAAGVFARHNIGVRHVLPLLAVLYVIGGGVVSALRTRLSVILIALIVVMLSLQIKKIHPDYLAYFNEVVGGAPGGINALDDSNLDWGMDLKRLPSELAKYQIAAVGLDFFGRERPAYRKLVTHPLHVFDRYFPEGDQVISAQWLRRESLIPVVPHYAYNWLEHYTPTAVIGHSLYVYRFRLGEKSAFHDGIQWISHDTWKSEGLKRLEGLMVENPKFYAGWIALAQAYMLFGADEKAQRALHQAQALGPQNPAEPQQLLEEFRRQRGL